MPLSLRVFAAAAALLALASPPRAVSGAGLEAWETVFFDDFESCSPPSLVDPARWKARKDRVAPCACYSAHCTLDPLAQRGNVMSFRMLVGGGDVWSIVAPPGTRAANETKNPRRFRVSLSYLGLRLFNGTNGTVDDLGGFCGYALNNTASGGTRLWWLGSSGGYPQDPVDDGAWRTYTTTVDFDLWQPAAENHDEGLRVLLQDYQGSGGDYGDVFFDDVRIERNRWSSCGDGFCDADENCTSCIGDCGACPVTTTATTGSATTGLPPATTTGVPPTTTGSTTGVPTTTARPATTPSAESTASSGSDPFPWWLIAVIAGAACCCCLIILALFFVMRRRRANDQANDEALELHTPRGSINTAVGSVHASNNNSNYRPVSMASMKPVTEVALTSEVKYARIPDRSVVSNQNYLSVTKVVEQAAVPTGVMQLDPDEVLVDSTNILGKGAFGTVFSGSYRGTPVAVKMLHEGFTDEQLNAFYDECEIVAALGRHENVVGFLGMAAEPAVMIVMELCESGSVRSYLREPSVALSLEQQLKLIRDVAAGMEFLSGNNIVHREYVCCIFLMCDCVPCV
jgi:Protein tyrosine and serine/threonine kinase